MPTQSRGHGTHGTRRRLCRTALPLERGIILDPFAGNGSTIAAAEALGSVAVGVERHREFYDMACKAVPG